MFPNENDNFVNNRNIDNNNCTYRDNPQLHFCNNFYLDFS